MRVIMPAIIDQVGRSFNNADDTVDFQQYGTPAVQKHGTPGSWSLT